MPPGVSSKTAAHLRLFRHAVLSWYQSNRRELPWRTIGEPYRILVSEIMLQQTQVDRVVPKYLAFLKAFPTARKLAHAKTSEVIMLWSGLGYNRRAVSLQRAAQAIVERGSFPSAFGELRLLPGIGPYTARALECFAFRRDVAVIDTNIRRIFSRYFFNGAGTLKKIDRVASGAVPHGRGSDWGNALMDFGSLVCTAAAPKCGLCPLRKSCTAYRCGKQESFLRVGRPQSRFEGSRRQLRGMVLRMLKETEAHAMALAALRRSLRKPKGALGSILAGLEKDHLVVREKGRVRLP